MRSAEFKAFMLMYMSDYMECLDDGNGGRVVPELHRDWMGLTEFGRVAIAAPRNFAKSTIFSVGYPLFCALEEYAKDIMIVSAASHLAEWFLGKIKRELESNANLYNDYGDQRSLVWRQDHIELKNGCVIRARGAECMIRGYRPDLVCVDDIENDESVASDTCRARLDDWFWKTLINLMGTDAQLVMIGTLLHPESLLSKIIRKPPDGWKTKLYRAIDEGGKSIWPSRWPLEELERRQAEIGTASFQQEYMNNPIPDEWRKFKENQFKYFENPPSYCNFFTMVDPAMSVELKKDPDYTVVMTVAVDPDKNIYVIDYSRRRALPSETITEILRHFQTYKSDCIAIETVAFQKVLKYMFEEKCREFHVYPYIKEINPGGQRKKFRIERLQPFFEQGKVYMRSGMTELKTELITFPTGSHDDTVDCLQMALDIIQPGFVPKPQLPEDCFESFWQEHKRKRQSMRIGATKYGNHKLRNQSFSLS